MTPKPILPKDLLKDIKPSNKAWLEEYKGKSGPRKKYSHSHIQEFLEFCAHNDDKEIDKIDETDVIYYVVALGKNNASSYTINGRLSALSSFGKFLHSQRPDIFSEKFLSALPYTRDRIGKNPTDIKPLSLEQLAYVRRYNRRSVKDQYIFESFFQLGIDKNDLVACNFPKTRNAQVDNLIRRMRKGEVTSGTIDSYFTRITRHLRKQGVYDESRRKINSLDLTASHKAYFWYCPNCGMTFENISKYWVLAKVRFTEAGYQDEYRIVCADCKGVNRK